MRLAICLSILVLFVFPAFPGQGGIAVGQAGALVHNQAESARVDSLNKLALEKHFVSLVDAISYGRQALELSVKIGYVNGEAYAYRNLGSSYTVRGDFVSALQFLEKARLLFEEIGSESGRADCFISIGHVYRAQLDYEQATVYQYKAAEIYKSLAVPERYAIALHNLGENYLIDGELEKAEKTTLEAVDILEDVGDWQVVTSCYKVLGQIAAKRGELDQAERSFDHALSISDSLGKASQKQATFECYTALAEIYKHKKFEEKELAMLQKAVALAVENQMFAESREGYASLIDFYFDHQRFVEAQKAYKNLNLFNEDLLRRQKVEMAKMMEQVLQTVRMASENEALRATQTVQEERIKRQKTQIFTFLASLILFIIIVAVMMRSMRQRKILSRELAQQNRLVEEKSARLEELIAVKDKFFSILSHDMRSPLNTLSQFVSLLQSNYNYMDFTEEELERTLHLFSAQLSSTLVLTDDIILWAKSEMGQKEAEYREFSINDVIESVLNVTAEALRIKGITPNAGKY